jgi:hypothetical protein
MLLPANHGTQAEAALAFALAGDARAESLAQGLGKCCPLDKQMQALWLPTIQAQLALNKKNPVSALTALQAATPMEFGGIQFTVNTSCLYPTYIRGEAYLAAGQARTLPPSSRKSSPTAVSSGTAGREPWRIWAWRVRMRCKRKLHKALMQMPRVSALSPPTKTSSPSGKTPTPTSPSTSKPKPSTRSCNSNLPKFSLTSTGPPT